jgi:low affinity Fe/Cu permease
MFDRFARVTADWTGRPLAFVLACLLVLIWAITGPLYDWSDSHSLVINTITTVITFLMVFCLQYSQDTDTRAIQAKLDALLAGCDAASNDLIDLEHRPRDEVELAKQQIIEGHSDV